MFPNNWNPFTVLTFTLPNTTDTSSPRHLQTPHAQWLHNRPTRGGGRRGTDLERGYGYVPRSWSPFFRPVGTPLPTNLPSMRCSCAPHFQFQKKLHFQPCFWSEFQLSRRKIFWILAPKTPFFQENPLSRPYFWKPALHISAKKQSWLPPPRSPEPIYQSYNALIITSKTEQF